MWDYVIIGAGLAGSVLAERIASQLNKKVLIIEKRNHVGGNCYDSYDQNGILVHNYGPHIFHTKIAKVWDYLSQFTRWIEYHHRVLGFVDGQKIPIPFNLNSLYSIFPNLVAKKLEQKLIRYFGYNKKIPILKLRQIEDPELNFLAEYVYGKIFLNYTLKQWGVKPEELDPYVTGRVPIYISRDNRYFQDRFQGIPVGGYTNLFLKMLEHPNIKILLKTNFKEILNIDLDLSKMVLMGKEFNGKVIYTGPIDYFFDYKYGKLPYRSLQFHFHNINTPFYQEVGTVNYPNDYHFLRITEFKFMTSQQSPTTTIVKEYPQEYIPGVNIPYYPIKNTSNQLIYELYKNEAKRLPHVFFVGRLAEYQYYDMDAVVSKALRIFDEKINLP
ncbi:UDP-galactopyranose mutase [Ammoniphilus sp. CFH 90114]|uniref:UDP-galactopyranose mutase n=1 Tax=Ammoniphilus sp. CFH 90114 TaxID=2493665 RepID=UPI00100E179E|nr:UDP-galactopyranose mutase [Ammoniphilus sp. CFH 90114]RXT01946.1 UDP-galactopyranose mutase [Ammoniphilus sp. CFH 90114]